MAVMTVLPRRNLGTAFTGFARSPNIWYDCPWDQIVNGEIAGQYIDLDFCKGGLITSPTTEAALVGYDLSGFGSSGSTQTYVDAEGSGLALTEATDNESVGIRTKTCPFQIASTKGKFWFEARVKVSTITDNAMGAILGLYSDVTMTVDIPLSSANPPIMATTVNYIGFRMPEEDAGMWRFSHDTNDTAQATNGESTIKSSAYQAVADTYVNLGMVFDPNDQLRLNSGRPTLAGYVNNLVLDTVQTVPASETTADTATFPSGYRMGLMAFCKSGSGAMVFTIQWMRAAQLQA